MRRTIFLLLGFLEFVVAVVLVHLIYQVPSTTQVDRSFHSAERVTDRAGNQVRLLRQQVQGLRRMELQQLSKRLQNETRTVTATMRAQTIDFETVRSMRDALGEVSKGLNGLGDTLDPSGVGKLGTGLGETASFLDQKVVPGAKLAADHLDEATAALSADAQNLNALLRETPLDLKTVREVYNSLAVFRDGLDKMNKTLELKRFEKMKEGFEGLETSLSTGADQVERLSGYTYPVLSWGGLRMEVNQRPFWPEGDKIAEGMRKAAAGATAASKEMNSLATDLPKIRASLAESRNLVDKVREALGLALAHQDKIEPLLKEAPEHAARMAKELPKLGGDLSRILRDTERLKDVAKALRQSQKGIDTAVANWPELRRTLARLATVLKATHDQLDQALQHRREYEAAMQQTIQLADTFATLLPLVTNQLDSRLDEEERTLSDLSQSLDEVNSALPAYAQTTSSLLQTGRLLIWLVTVIVGLHGCYLMLSARIGRSYSL